MIEPTDKWLRAQREEYQCHENKDFYISYYENCAELLDYNLDLNGKSIIEIGPARVPFLSICRNWGKAYVIEPLSFSDTKEFYSQKGIQEINQSAEQTDFPEVDEIIIFNVLQHVMDPVFIINKSKVAAKSIYFIEPINTGVDNMHLWSFDLNFFKQHFSNTLVYKGGTRKGFHGVDCAYGVWKLC